MRRCLISLAGACIGAAVLAACGGANSGLSPNPETQNAARSSRSALPDASKQIQIESYSCCYMAVDPVLNRIYMSSGINLSGNYTTVVDGGGSAFSVVATVTGFGGANDVDSKTHNVWLPGLYGGDVDVYSGITKSSIKKVSLSDCPVTSWVDGKRRYAWVAAQCGADNDPVWALNADSYKVVAGPIGSGGVMGGVSVLNPLTGKYYFNDSAGNFEVDPRRGFALSPTSLGIVLGANGITGVLYGQATNGLNIVAGRSEKITKTVALSYTPSFMGVNPHLNHIYLSAGLNSIEVREGTAGKLLKNITLASDIRIAAIGADHMRARIYAIGISGSNDYLYEIKDKY
ncbi:MAG: hypothetical protein WAL67_03110 [Candidatus Cybelea sp.]